MHSTHVGLAEHSPSLAGTKCYHWPFISVSCAALCIVQLRPLQKADESILPFSHALEWLGIHKWLAQASQARGPPRKDQLVVLHELWTLSCVIMTLLLASGFAFVFYSAGIKVLCMLGKHSSAVTHSQAQNRDMVENERVYLIVLSVRNRSWIH